MNEGFGFRHKNVIICYWNELLKPDGAIFHFMFRVYIWLKCAIITLGILYTSRKDFNIKINIRCKGLRVPIIICLYFPPVYMPLMFSLILITYYFTRKEYCYSFEDMKLTFIFVIWLSDVRARRWWMRKLGFIMTQILLNSKLNRFCEQM